MRYFGSKQYVQPDEDAIAAERLMAIANRFKADLPSSAEGFEVASENEESLDLFEQPEPPAAPESRQ